MNVYATRIASLVVGLLATPSIAVAQTEQADPFAEARTSVAIAVELAQLEAADAADNSESAETEPVASESTDSVGPTPTEQTDAEPELTAEELAALEAATSADAAEVEPADEPGPVARIVDSMNPDLALILDVALAAFSDEPLQIGAHDPSANGFNLQQLEMSIGANVDPYFRLDANLVFSQFGVEVEEAYATTLALPWNLQMRAGQFLTEFGRLNPTHPHSWAFLDQPLVNGKFFGGEGSRGLGAEASWLSPLPWFVELTAAANQADGECCARSFYGGDDLGVDGPADLLYTTRLEQFFPMGTEFGLLWGMSAQFGPNPTGAGNRTEIYGTDLYLRWRPDGDTDRTSVDFTVEAMMRQRQVPDDLLRDFGTRAELVWNITGNWQTGVRHEWVSGVDDDPLDPEWDTNRQRVAIQGTFFPSHFSRIRLQGAWDAPEWRDEPIFAAMLGLEILAGAHGSHAY